MDEETKANAIKKANGMLYLIGYPDYILDEEKLMKQYENWTVSANSSWLETQRNYMDYFHNERNHDLIEEKRRTSWPETWVGFNPTTINAGYSPTSNSILFTAGIL